MKREGEASADPYQRSPREQREERQTFLRNSPASTGPLRLPEKGEGERKKKERKKNTARKTEKEAREKSGLHFTQTRRLKAGHVCIYVIIYDLFLNSS